MAASTSVPSVTCLLFMGTGIGLLLGAALALDGLAVASVMLLVNGIRNAWDTVVWFALKVESPPR